MRLHEIESWARRVIARAERSGQKEDSLVELKAKCPDARWSARQLGGHANAARGATILWLLGVDEKNGVVGCEHFEVGDWYAQIRSEFDGAVAPALLGHAAFEHNGRSVMPLAFSTDRPPYVIRNPQRDTPKAGPFSLEVPWREGTNVRSANRGELLLLLSEQVLLPRIEVLQASIVVTRVKKRTSSPAGTDVPEADAVAHWYCKVVLYATFRGTEAIIVPFHTCHLAVQGFEWPEPFVFEGAKPQPPRSWSRNEGTRTMSLTIEGTQDELVIQGSGKIVIESRKSSDDLAPRKSETLELTGRWFAAGHDQAIAFSAQLLREPIDPDHEPHILDRWALKTAV